MQRDKKNEPSFLEEFTKLVQDRNIRAVAKEAGLGFRTIYNITDGTTADPGILVVKAVVEACGFTLYEFCEPWGERKDPDVDAEALRAMRRIFRSPDQRRAELARQTIQMLTVHPAAAVPPKPRNDKN